MANISTVNGSPARLPAWICIGRIRSRTTSLRFPKHHGQLPDCRRRPLLEKAVISQTSGLSHQVSSLPKRGDAATAESLITAGESSQSTSGFSHQELPPKRSSNFIRGAGDLLPRITTTSENIVCLQKNSYKIIQKLVVVKNSYFYTIKI